jgi:hypothetical protein
VTKKSKGATPRAARRSKSTGRVSEVDAASRAGDIAMVVARDADGVHILRRRSEESPLEAGLLRPMREGQPITGEVITLKQRADVPVFYDVKTEFGGPEDPGAQQAEPQAPPMPVPGPGQGKLPGDGRPAQVSSDAYRKGWDAVWGRRRDRSVN